MGNSVQSALTLGLFLQLDCFPIYQHFCATTNCGITKNVRVTTNKLVYNFVDNLLQIKVSCFFRHTGVENYLHQHVAKFFAHTCNIVVINCFNVFVNLFNEIATNGFMGLLNIPGATTGLTQSTDYINQRLYVHIVIRAGIHKLFFISSEHFHFVLIFPKFQNAFRHRRDRRNIDAGQMVNVRLTVQLIQFYRTALFIGQP